MEDSGHLTLGQKIKNYRKRSGLSQFDLELKIATSPGSLSRIENDQVNPTKESLSKIASYLNLAPNEIGDLLNIKVFTPEQLIGAINKISKSFDLDTTLQATVDSMYDLYPYYNGGGVLLIDRKDKNKLCTTYVSRMPNIELAEKFLPKKLSEYYVLLDKYSKNFFAKTVLERNTMHSNDISDFGNGLIAPYIFKPIAKILGFKVGVSIPLIVEDDVVGVAFFTKRIESDFSKDEEHILSLLSDQIAIAIKNAQKYEDLINELNKLKYGK